MKKILRTLHIRKNKARLTNTSPTIIASNCNGTFILHDLGLKFNSPFINLWIEPGDYLKLLANFDEYMGMDLKEIHVENIDYPVGKLGDISLYFQHYDTFDNAKKKWNIRKERINKDNFFVLFTDRDGCTYEQLQEFDKLPYRKIVFTNKEYPDIKSSVYIKGFESQPSVGICSDFMPNKKWLRYLDQFDYVEWLNQKP